MTNLLMMKLTMMKMMMTTARSMMVMMIALRRRVSFLEMHAMSVMNDHGGGGLNLPFAFLQHKLCKLCLLRISMSTVLTILTFRHFFSPNLVQKSEGHLKCKCH